MKKPKKKQNVITRHLLIVILVTAVITAIITQITTGLISSVYSFARNQIWPPELDLSLSECIIYRTDFDEFPVCEMDIVINNLSGEPLTAELKEMRLFRDGIVHRFAAGQEVIKVGAKDLLVKHVEFRDEVLDQALKVPQDSSTAIIELTYEYVGRNSRGRLTLGDGDVIKCTYYQAPVFESEAEALAMGAVLFTIGGPVYLTDTIGVSHTMVLDLKVFTDRQGPLDFDGEKFAGLLLSGKFEIPLTLSSAFRRRYGGMYLGFLASDPNQPVLLGYAKEVLGHLGDYEEYALFGTTFGQDFSNIMEFIHYSFDPVRQSESFKLCQDNSEFYILLLYEDSDGLSSIIDSLQREGYRVGSAPAKRFGALQHALTLIVPTEKLASLAEKLNIYVDSLNFVLNNDGLFLFFPAVLDPKTEMRIIKDINQAAGKPHSVALSFDCRPFKSCFLPAPFSTPVLVFLNFSQETMDGAVDSITVEYLSPP